MSQILLTLLFALAAFALFFGAIGLGIFLGRVKKRRCACAAAKAVMKQVEDRQKAARDALRYRPETVDPSALPILPESLTPSRSRERD